MIWNPWHGCTKYSEGCQNCYVYRRDASIGKDASVVTKTKSFAAPLARGRDKSYKIKPHSQVYACMTSDFFIEAADGWRAEAWEMMRLRSDVKFLIITKRIVRFTDCIPPDWGDGYPNISIGCTVENQRQCDVRLPVFHKIPARDKFIICEPLLGKIDLRPYLTDQIRIVVAGGESGKHARPCDYAWVCDLAAQCREKNVSFHFKQTGAHFVKDGRTYTIARQLQMPQAKKAGIDFHAARRRIPEGQVTLFD